MNCPNCKKAAKKFGKNRKGNQRFRCLSCGKTFQEPRVKILDNMTLADEKALSVLVHLIEGCSIRTTERLTGVHRDTIMRLLLMAGNKCEVFMHKRIQGLKVQDVECDELWSFIGMKAKTAAKQNSDDFSIGDAWTFTAIERNSKLILAWHLGHRTMHDTVQFTEKLAHATDGGFQVTADGFAAYKDAMHYSLGARQVDFAQLIKIYQNNPETETRYSPAKCIGTKKNRVFGRPDRDRVSTSIIERSNLSVRMENRRFTRLTNAFSKRWANHRAALALYFAYYNFCRMHKTLRCTPAMAADITKTVWSLEDLLLAASHI